MPIFLILGAVALVYGAHVVDDVASSPAGKGIGEALPLFGLAAVLYMAWRLEKKA